MVAKTPTFYVILRKQIMARKHLLFEQIDFLQKNIFYSFDSVEVFEVAAVVSADVRGDRRRDQLLEEREMCL